MREGSESDDGKGPSAVRGSLRSTGELIVTSRLLTLQSRRVLLAIFMKQFFFTGDENLKEQMKSMEERVATAERDYRKAVLRWASPETAQYWLVSYQRMIEEAEDLAIYLRTTAAELPATDRAEVSADVIRLDHVIERWRKVMVNTMAGGGEDLGSLASSR